MTSRKLFCEIAPRRIAALAIGLVLAAGWLSIWIAVKQPWLGLVLEADARGQVVVAYVHTGGPAQGVIRVGEVIRGIEGDGAFAAVAAGMLIEEPDVLETYAQYNSFLAAQDRLYRALKSVSVTLHTGSGPVVVNPHAIRPLAALPILFWFQLICGALAAISAAAVIAFKRRSDSARVYALTGAAFVVVTFSAAIYSTREIALDQALFRNLSVLNHLGSLVFTAAFVSLLWLYPARLGSARIPMLMLIAYLGVWVADTLQIMADLDAGFRIPVIAGLALSAAFAILQWRRSKQTLVERAALKWFLFSLYLGGATFVFAVFVTLWLGWPPPLSQGYAFGILTVMYLGIAAGISRYRLFELDRWWLNFWLWLIAGTLVVIADIAIAHLVNLSHSLALAVALALVGWVYFPVRQWLVDRVLGQRPQQIETFLPYLLELGFASGSQTTLRRNWAAMLRQMFNPLDVADVNCSATKVSVTDQGLALIVPGLGSSPALKLGYRSGGRRFFTAEDATLAEALFRLADQAVASQSAYQHGVSAERARLAADLHDDVASRLLTLMHRATEPALAELAREALKDLRAVVANLGSSAMLACEAIADWHTETEERCEAANVQLSWDDAEVGSNLVLTPHQRINLQRILREAVSNALRHSDARSIAIRFSSTHSLMLMSVKDSGGGIGPDWIHGQGLQNMRNRVTELGGKIDLHASPEGTVVEVQIDALPGPSDVSHLALSGARG